MYTVDVFDWEPGFRKVSHTKLLQERCSSSLAEAKAATDALLRGDAITLRVASQLEAESLVVQLSELGAHARVQSSAA
jgi:ribosomal protein L7/L12